jgi:hypothetical protein
MRLGTEIRVTVWTLLALQLCTSAGGILLFTRMAPAIQNILEENVASLRAVEQIQHALASTGSGRERLFERALAEAESNVTEASERPVLRRLRRVKTAALAGDPAALRQTLGDLERLAMINLAAMERADRQAARLGEGGAWAMAILGMVCFLVSIWAARKVARQITRPLTRIHEALGAFRGGDTRRRCAIHGAALEATEIARAVDHLLDAAAGAPEPEGGAGNGAVARAALLALLDDEQRPALVISRAGEVVAANGAGLDALGQESSLRDRVLDRLLERGEAEDLVADARPVGDGWIVRLAD